MISGEIAADQRSIPAPRAQPAPICQSVAACVHLTNVAAERKKIVIVGGGFAGLSAATVLARYDVEITLIDRKNYHTFQPFLYQVATAGLSPGEIAAPIRSILSRYRNVSVLLGEVTAFDVQQRLVRTSQLTLPYDYLIVAAGAGHSYFGHDDWESLAPGLKTVEDALEIRRRVLLAFELAEMQARATGSHEPVHIVIVGGGPTGIELAGTLAEVTRRTLASDFRLLDPKRTQITLVEGAPRLMPHSPPDLSAYAKRKLEELGVGVLLGTHVTAVEVGRLKTETEYLPATVTIWAAGVKASILGTQLGVPTDRAGRVIVENDLSLAGHPEVFVVGDLAAFANPDGSTLPGLAPVALQEGRAAAHNIVHDLQAEPRKPFHYRDKGTMAFVGRAAAIAEIGNLHLTGFIAWLMWLFVHIMYLVGFRNRVLVLIEWAWSYLTYQRSARLITGSTELPGFEAAPRSNDVPKVS